MGFRRKAKTYTLVWPEDHEYSGLEVTMAPLSVGDLMGFNPETMTNSQLIELLNENLISWNLEDEDGTPVPADENGIASLDVGMMAAIAFEWLQGVAGVPAPLERPSLNGHNSVEALNLAALSQSLPN